MPKIVDWDKRRDEVLAATWRVIAREGLQRTTIRRIAGEAGYSPGVLAHYFTNKQDILSSALMLCHTRVRDRMRERTKSLIGLDALRVVIEEALPLDEERDLEAGIEINFWSQTLGNPELAKLQHNEFEPILDDFRHPLLEAKALGQLSSDLDIEEAARALMVLMDGLSIERVLFPSRTTPELQLRMLDLLLRTFDRGLEEQVTVAVESE